MLYSIVGLLVIILDQAVKFWVSNTLFGTDVVRFIPGVISLVNVHNDGAAFSFLSGQGARIYFIIATGVFVLLVIIALATNFIRGKFARWCLVFVAAGGIANMIDRVIYGYVQDMFKVELFNFAIFNVADVFITVFSILFALAMIFERPETDMVDVLYEADDEDERPEKAPRKKLFGKKDKTPETAEDTGDPAAASAAVPAKDSSVRSARKSRQEKYEQEYQEYKAQQRAAMSKKNAKDTGSEAVPPVSDALPEPSFDIPERRKAKPAPVPVPAAQPEADPYAAWDIANQRAQASLADSQTSRLMGAQKPVEQPKTAAAPAPAPRPTPAAKPAEPAKAPSPKPADSDSGDEFSLDDILAEFK